MPPQGSKASYSPKQRRQARHIEESEMEQGRSRKSAQRIGWATVNKQDGGAKGRGKARPAGRASRTRAGARRTAKAR